MNNQNNNRENIPFNFLETDGGKTKTNTIEVPSINLPKGGGAIKGINEKFTVNAVNGTASFSIPLPFSPVRGVSPALDLSYNSGAGNSIFGLGWDLSLPSIKRKTNKRLPQYYDDIDLDTFLFSGAEDLVPEFKKEIDGSFSIDNHGNYIIKENSSGDSKFTIRFYRPRIEGLFARIERWSSKTSGEIKWRVTTKDNVTTLFGWSEASRIYDPKDKSKIFEWMPEFVSDDKGNCWQYIYKREDAVGFDDMLLCNKNRIEEREITYTNLYLERVLYGNKTPYDKKFNGPYLPESDYMFQTVLDYGEYETDAPYLKTNSWDVRGDAFSDYKAGFEIRTTRLCKRVLLFHYFDEFPEGSALVKSMNFQYDTFAQEGFTFLKSITTYGYIKKSDGTYTYRNFPATEFEYQKHEWNKEVTVLSSEDLVHAPSGIDEQQYELIDLFNEGMPGILTEQANGWFYKHNLGEGKFEEAKLVSPKPSFSGLGRTLHLMDLDSDGGKQLVNFSTEPKGYFELTDEEEWQAFRTFRNLPDINMQDPNVRMLDLNGDGMPEAVITEDNVFTWYESAGRKGFESVHKTVKSFDEEKGPHIVFADLKQTIFLADMSGDGITDIVRIRNGEACYWPNLGYGRFGAKVAMDNAPTFDHPDLFNPAYLRLADIDGSGTTDIIYLGKDKFTCWMNLNGNSFSTVPFEIDVFPEIHRLSKIIIADFLGKGVACIIWSSSLSKDAHAPLKYIDLMSGKKPHIMVSYKNNFGKEVSIEYTQSTKFYIEDKKAGRPWVTKLHFPVQCISKIETRDTVSGYRFINTYKYHHGYYDHGEREFRGFGMVEQWDAEYFKNSEKGDAGNSEDKELNQKPVITKSWFHTGAFFGREKILNQFKKDYWYEEMKRQGFNVVNYELLLPDAKLIAAPAISDSVIDHLSVEEWKEALRACKGMALRSEVFAKDAPISEVTPEEIKKELTPYSAVSCNYVIELLQPRGQNKHAVFVVKESESITYSYERDTKDPRIAHNLNIKLDEYGNILESASVVYPRLFADTSLPVETQQLQNHNTIIYTQNKFTNDVIDEDKYRLRLPYEVKHFELKGVTKTGNFYKVADFEKVIETSSTALYHETDKEPVLGTSQKRLIEHVRTRFYDEVLMGPLPFGKLNSKGLSYESYQLAYTPELLVDIFKTKVNETLMAEGKFINGEADNDWWIRSGIIQYIDADKGETAINAQSRFHVPVSYIDPYGSKTKVKYDNYLLFVKVTEDILGNKQVVDLFNYRTLSPQKIKDPNENISEVITDELGLVKAMAVFGKGNEADDLSGITEFTTSAENTMVNDFFNSVTSDKMVIKGKNLIHHSTARYVYNFDLKPVVVASILREEHFQKNNDSPVQLSFEYSNGLGQVVMKKVQAEPGIAKKTTINSDGTVIVEEIDTTPHLRWIGSGRVVLNNKGNPVKQYEPYFSVTHKYETLKELVETGVTQIFYYDAPGRLIKTDFPDETFSKTEFDSWKHRIYDQNDTILESSWYHNRINNLIDNELLKVGKNPDREKQAAEKAAKHANTPIIQHFDTLGRVVLSIEHNKNKETDADEFYHTKVNLDTEGNLRSVTDARSNRVMLYKYDMLGNKVYQNSMDGGQRWLLPNVLGNLLRTWDERSHEFQYFYDELHRFEHSKVLGGDGDTPLNNIFERIFYGEKESNSELKNLRGKIIRHYDTGGLVYTPEYDFKGQAQSDTRRLFKDYKGIVNWIDTNLDADLENDSFTIISESDALRRTTRQTMPDGSVITPYYNEGGLLNSEVVAYADSGITTAYIKNIDYNEKRQRNKIIYGNDVFTNFYYDKETFRLNRLKSKRGNNDPLQDWNYTFDPVGNITHIEDKNIPTVFFNNQKITGISTYTYDAIYRLIEATGRENDAALSYGSKDNWNDEPFMHQLNSGDPMTVRNYTQKYEYDSVGNILKMQHNAAGNDWMRNYNYQAANNRLISTQIRGNTYAYFYHVQHGFMTSMPHLEEVGWSFKEEIIKTIRQKRIDGGTPETTYYQYDGQGQRIRKITENQADAGINPTKKEERIYLGGYELYKKHTGSYAGLERISLSLIDNQQRFVMIETRNNIDDGTEKQLVRYQLGNHLGSVCMELDGTREAKVISYEEYHPYGTTAYHAKNAAIKAAAKRYRYTGKERDEESGLYYHGARYYIPWIGRWTACDPMEKINRYVYVSNSPIRFFDPDGKDESEGSNRFWGGMRMLGGASQYVLGGFALAVPEPTMLTKVVGGIALVNGADDFSTGLHQLLSGHQKRGVIESVVTITAEKVMSPQNAQALGTGTSMALGLVSPTGPMTNGPRSLPALAQLSTGERVLVSTTVETTRIAENARSAQLASNGTRAIHTMMKTSSEDSSSNTSSSSSTSSSPQEPNISDIVDEAISRIDQGELRASGAHLQDLTSHAQASKARLERGISGQSAHIAPRSGMRSVKEYNPEAALTRLLDVTSHRGFDDSWKNVFMQRARASGETTITVEEFFNTVRDAAGSNPHFTTEEANSMVELLRDELFVQHNLNPGDQIRLPYSK